MKERPLIFSSESIRAILEGKKTQTRRVVNMNKVLRIPKSYGMDMAELHQWNVAAWPARISGWVFWQTTLGANGHEREMSLAYDDGMPCPYGVPGDQLWVRETWEIDPNEYGWDEQNRRQFINYKADCPADYKPWWGWNSSIFMPRWASRLVLEVKEIRVQRVQEISQADVDAEIGKGVFCYPDDGKNYPHYYAYLWDQINAGRGYPWSINPWVWAVTFEVIEKP